MYVYMGVILRKVEQLNNLIFFMLIGKRDILFLSNFNLTIYVDRFINMINKQIMPFFNIQRYLLSL